MRRSKNNKTFLLVFVLPKKPNEIKKKKKRLFFSAISHTLRLTWHGKAWNGMNKRMKERRNIMCNVHRSMSRTDHLSNK